jgi:predicted nucleotidyltransferase
MNERIKELAEQAGWDMGDEVCGFTTRLDKFAALVAAEKEKQIIDILERLQQRNDSHNYYAYAINVIKQGVSNDNK